MGFFGIKLTGRFNCKSRLSCRRIRIHTMRKNIVPINFRPAEIPVKDLNKECEGSQKYVEITYFILKINWIMGQLHNLTKTSYVMPFLHNLDMNMLQ